MAFVLLGAVQIMLIATTTVITVASPAIQRDLHGGETGLVPAGSAYGLAFGGLLLLGGRSADSLGRRRVFVTGGYALTLRMAAALLITALFSAHTRRRKKTKENTE